MERAFFQFRLGTKASSKMESNMDRVHHTAFRAKQRNMKAIGQITCLMAMVHSSTLRVYLVVHEQANTLVKLSKIIYKVKAHCSISKEISYLKVYGRMTGQPLKAYSHLISTTLNDLSQLLLLSFQTIEFI